MTQIVLASGSQIRGAMLRDAGVEFTTDVPRVDEESILLSLQAEGAKPGDIADTLAEYKARRIADRHPASLVIAADQVLTCNGQVYSKPKSIDEAREHLKSLRGQGHQLLSAVVVYEETKPVWRHIGRAQLAMRDFSDDFLEDYLEKAGDTVLSSVGCYQLENIGVTLFSRVQGDYFTILGLPLLEVLDFLRSRGAIQS
ncbi:Maf family nucleotide pyrophosphatase [Neptunicoccus cionae]|uniref:Nucleoside triphosphate pyrophosphatase n=1 Tax=Neptunicoccus cionae TaxID=2035344 RepID=A0A916VPY6_9RHOB|nr:Maf family nucleotide pyrophosphatase [Amylibacter cionae]GGA18727.1 Maf-like protein [Amylibacter cionae]